MTTADPSEIKLFRWSENLPLALWQDLQKRPAPEAADAVGASWDGGHFKIALLGRNYAVDPKNCVVSDLDEPGKRVSFQAGLILITTLANSTGAAPSGEMVLPRELPGGDFFFVGPHAINTPALERRFGADPAELIERGEALGGRPVEGADAAVVVQALPMIPMWAMVWQSDEEFPAKAVVGIDSRAHYHMALDVVFALTNIFIHRLTGGRNG